MHDQAEHDFKSLGYFKLILKIILIYDFKNYIYE